MVRKNKDIAGIKINDREHCVSQYADGTLFILDGSESSLQATVQVLNQFSLISGLRINFDKSEIVWIGSKKGSGARYMPHCEFKWNPPTFTVLGIVFSSENLCNMGHLNYLNKLTEIRIIIAKWMKRILTATGKIAVIKFPFHLQIELFAANIA